MLELQQFSSMVLPAPSPYQLDYYINLISTESAANS